MGLKDTLQKIHFPPLKRMCKLFHCSQRQFCPGGTQNVPRAAASGFDLLQLPDGEQWLRWQLHFWHRQWDKKSLWQGLAQGSCCSTFWISKTKEKASPLVLWWILGPTTAQGWHFRNALLSLSTLLLLPHCFLYQTKYKRQVLKKVKLKIAWPKQEIASLKSPLKFCFAFHLASWQTFSQVSQVSPGRWALFVFFFSPFPFIFR